ncbi:uncharacterized protein LOC123314200 [Coccinella septempunctata]|uniref:uncharacterized protein LOC123314200 n=1 Tax=Coccinella septempunctata TaxID=41139 RepID=UPI001D089840|nr:uncharacterized protein LOC123314200 [Coccinella septempunctata]
MQHHFFFDPLEIRRETRYPKQQDLNYGLSTQVGNWFEERQTYKKNFFKHSSSYSNDFTPKPYSKVEANFIWSEKFKSEGVDPIVHTRYGCLDHPNFFENFSTTYDLSFNHYPKWYKHCGNINRKLRLRTLQYEPLDDYIDSFDNITRQGLVEQKKDDWCQDKWSSFFTQRTHNQETFKPPSQQDYNFVRHAPPKCNSSRFYAANLNAAKQLLRDGVPAYTVVPSFDLVRVPTESRCDPLTWECPKTK